MLYLLGMVQMNVTVPHQQIGPAVSFFADAQNDTV